MTSVTKLPRRVFTFSKKNLEQSIRYNMTGGDVFLALNFANYIDYRLTGLRGSFVEQDENIRNKLENWMNKNIGEEYINLLRFIGTGPKIDDMITYEGMTD
jgi:hypothetical protein